MSVDGCRVCDIHGTCPKHRAERDTFPAYERANSWRKNNPKVRRSRRPKVARCDEKIRGEWKCDREADGHHIHTTTIITGDGKAEVWAKTGTEVWRVQKTEEPRLF